MENPTFQFVWRWFPWVSYPSRYWKALNTENQSKRSYRNECHRTTSGPYRIATNEKNSGDGWMRWWLYELLHSREREVGTREALVRYATAHCNRLDDTKILSLYIHLFSTLLPHWYDYLIGNSSRVSPEGLRLWCRYSNIELLLPFRSINIWISLISRGTRVTVIVWD